MKTSDDQDSRITISGYFQSTSVIFQKEAKSSSIRLSALISLDFTNALRKGLFDIEWEEEAYLAKSLIVTLEEYLLERSGRGTHGESLIYLFGAHGEPRIIDVSLEIMKCIFYTYLEMLLTNPPVISEENINRISEDISILSDGFKKFRYYITDNDVEEAVRPLSLVVKALSVDVNDLSAFFEEKLSNEFASYSIKVFSSILHIRDESRLEELLEEANWKSRKLCTPKGGTRKSMSLQPSDVPYMQHYLDRLAKSPGKRKKKSTAKK